MNKISTQPGNIVIKFGNNEGCGKVIKSSSIIYHCLIYNSIEHKIYDYPY
jgi:hypothetical protein